MRCNVKGVCVTWQSCIQVWDFDLSYYWSIRLTYLALILLYGPTVPLMFPLGVVYFTANYVVDRYHMHGGLLPLSLPAASGELPQHLRGEEYEEFVDHSETQSTELTRLPRNGTRAVIIYCGCLLFIMSCVGYIAPNDGLTIYSFIMVALIFLLATVAVVGPWNKYVYYPVLAMWGMRILEILAACMRAIQRCCCGMTQADDSDEHHVDIFDLGGVTSLDEDVDASNSAKSRLIVVPSRVGVDLVPQPVRMHQGRVVSYVSPALHEAMFKTE
jgi:hypothetical protein